MEGWYSRMDKIENAIVFATMAHDKQARKLTNIPYITHPYHVGMLLLHAGCNEDIVCAGLLHDTVEDTDVTVQDLRNEFGDVIARLVDGCSEPNKNLPWEERKQHTINYLMTASKDICMIVCADKLSNIRSIRKEEEVDGDIVWKKFNRGKDKQEWYYRGVISSISRQLNGEPLLNDLIKEVEYLFS